MFFAPTQSRAKQEMDKIRKEEKAIYDKTSAEMEKGARSLFFPFAPISLRRVRTFECSRSIMPLRASSEALTSDRDSKNGGVSMRRPSSVRDSITASMPRCQTSVRLIWMDFQASRLRTSQ